MKKLLLTVMLMFGFVFTGCNANDNTPEGVILAFVEAVKKGDLDKAKSYCDKKSFDVVYRNGKVKNTLNEHVEAFYNALNRADINKWTFSVEDDRNIDTYNLYMKNPTSEFHTLRDGTVPKLITVKKIGNKLKITYI